jgi:25S rRNA (cytosine2870-C5)-methyltransferase
MGKGAQSHHSRDKPAAAKGKPPTPAPRHKKKQEEEEEAIEEMEDFEGLDEQDEDLEEGVEEAELEELDEMEGEELDEGLAQDRSEAEEGQDEGGEGDGEDDPDFPSHKGPMVPTMNFQDDADQIPVDETLAETDTQLLRMKINSHLKVLSNFKENREPDKPRTEYISELKEYYCHLYNYNKELMEIFFNLFSPHEVVPLYKVLSLLRIDGGGETSNHTNQYSQGPQKRTRSGPSTEKSGTRACW